MINAVQFLNLVPLELQKSLKILALMKLVETFNADPEDDPLHEVQMGCSLLMEVDALKPAMRFLREEALRESVVLINAAKLRSNGFRITSGLDEYASAFGAGLTGKLSSLGATGRWMDGGAGEARAQRGYLKEGSLDAKAFCLAVSFQKPDKPDLLEDEKTLAARFLYLQGPFEEMGGAQFGDASCDLITDMNGILYYSSDFGRDLRRYLTLLKIGGRLLFSEPGGVEFRSEGGSASMGKFLANIAGVSVMILNAGMTKAYQVDKNGEIGVIPALSCVEVEWKGQNSVARRYEVTGLIDVDVKVIKI